MREYHLGRNDHEPDPLPDVEMFRRDNGNRTLHLWLQASADFIMAACERRGVVAKCVDHHGFHITLLSSKEMLEEVREEFNTRPLGPGDKRCLKR